MSGIDGSWHQLARRINGVMAARRQYWLRRGQLAAGWPAAGVGASAATSWRGCLARQWRNQLSAWLAKARQSANGAVAAFING